MIQASYAIVPDFFNSLLVLFLSRRYDFECAVWQRALELCRHILPSLLPVN